MKNLSVSCLSFLFLTAALSGCHLLPDLLDESEPTRPKEQVLATGLAAPLGLEIDDKHRLWVSENGTGNNDGQISMVMPNGKVYPAITGFATNINPEGVPGGLNHLAYRKGMLYILSEAEGRLYMADISRFNPGSQPIPASTLHYQDIRSFILNYDFGIEDTEESNPYSLTFGPGGDLFFTDAAANAVIRRDMKTGELSVFAHFANIANPTKVGPPMINVVPTGIVWDGERFLVSSLIGFPFPAGSSRIYALSQTGEVAVYQEGFTSLVDIALGPQNLPVVLQFSEFSFAGGFQPMHGRVILATGNKTTILKDQLNLPTAMVLDGPKAYVTSLAEGSITKIVW